MTESNSPRGEAWLVFYEAWDSATRHLPRISPIPKYVAERSPAFVELDVAQRRAHAYMHDVLRWPALEAARVATSFALEAIIWARLDGLDRQRLRVRLQCAEARIRAAAALGMQSWATPLTRLDQQPAGVRPVHLPPAFYLPRATREGEEIRDVLPWHGATEYVSDGTRYGVRYEDGRIQWFEHVWTRLAETLHEEFDGVDLAGVVLGLKEYAVRQETLSTDLAHDIATLEAALHWGGG